MEYKEIEANVKKILSEYRFTHSVGVAKKAVELAKIYGVDEEIAKKIGIAHDVAKEMTDEEMIEYYTGLVKKYGKNLKAKWVYGMAIYDGKDVQTFTWSKGDFYFVGKPSPILNEGYPLDSISVLPDTGKYFVDLTRKEKDEYKNKNAKDDDVIKFILSSLNLE